jgi:hypothetical protein
MRDEKAKGITCTHPLVFATITNKKQKHPSRSQKVEEKTKNRHPVVRWSSR